MTEVINIKNELSIAYSKRRMHLFIFVIASILIVFLDAILLLTSKDSYAIELTFSILLTSLYLVYLVFYFSIIRNKYKNEFDFFDKASKSEKSTELVEFISFEDKKKINNGIDYFELNARTINELNKVEKKYLISRKIDFKKGKKYNVATFGKVIVSFEESR